MYVIIDQRFPMKCLELLSYSCNCNGPQYRLNYKFFCAYFLCTALDVSDSMGSPFEQDAAHGTKLDVAKKCLQTLTDQLKPR